MAASSKPQDVMRNHPKRRAISYILSVLMMTLVISALSSAVLVWGLDQVGQTRTQLFSAFRSRMERTQERIIVEDLAMLDSSTMRVFVRNVGAIQAVIDQVYTQHQPGTLRNAKGGGANATRLSLSIQEVSFVDVTVPAGITLVSSQSYLVRVATNRGTTSVGTWTM